MCSASKKDIQCHWHLLKNKTNQTNELNEPNKQKKYFKPSETQLVYIIFFSFVYIDSLSLRNSYDKCISQYNDLFLLINLVAE